MLVVRRQSCRLSYTGGGGPSSAYLPPPQFADGQSSECSETFSLGGGGPMGVVPISISTLPRRCHQGVGSDTQPLIIGASFRTLPRNPADMSRPYSGTQDGSSPGTQTLPLKSSLKKPSTRPETILAGRELDIPS